MAPFSKPETVLKQAEGLVSVGQTHAALQLLSEMFSPKRFRSVFEILSHAYEAISERMSLCNNGDFHKKTGAEEEDSLVSASAAGATIRGTWKVVEAKEKAREVAAKEVELGGGAAGDVDDLEAPSTPESILLSSFSSPSSASSIHSDCTSRALITPSLKFLWESYRTSLETLKNNARLETIYQSVAQKAECREIAGAAATTTPSLVGATAAGAGGSITAKAASGVGSGAGSAPASSSLTIKSTTTANYYEKLSRVFRMSGHTLYPATAWAQYYNLVTYAGAKAAGTGESKEVLAGKVIVRALVVPGGSGGSPSHHRLSALLNLPSPTSGSATSSTQNPAPFRSALLSSALSRDVLKLAHPTVQKLYHALEVDFDPWTLCESVAPLLEELGGGASTVASAENAENKTNEVKEGATKETTP
ncbi:hypothetical protein C8J55DRAFT_557772 [Lentinula edodes]|uniref:eIF3a PCI domain-containing protein n=1 Tax=Lentinula lateritia TaxID=40482 RepID=A0A9W9AR49_9AGAR|nr:hypothetical protein C8J55DRAFT_557772 [Lentinula edodes]